jgi:hypothetical protein
MIDLPLNLCTEPTKHDLSRYCLPFQAAPATGTTADLACH